MKILITGAAGFIGSNLVEYFLEQGYLVRALDNFATGFRSNIEPFLSEENFEFIEGDIRDLETCMNACDGIDYILHQAALGSVPRSIKDPLTTNDVNNNGFLNMLIAARDQKVSRFIYAASSSTYGDSKKLPKIEEEIGKPLSPYAITKYVNELYADVFAKTYNMQCIGLRYFNVFGKRQTPDGAYAAVIPLWVKQLINHESPIINGDGSYSRDFTYIDNVIQANEKAMLTPTEQIIKRQKDYYNEDLDNHKYFNESGNKDKVDNGRNAMQSRTNIQSPTNNRSSDKENDKIDNQNERWLSDKENDKIDNPTERWSSDKENDKTDNPSERWSSDSDRNEMERREPLSPRLRSVNVASHENSNKEFSEVFNVAYGGNTNLLDLFESLKKELAHHDPKIAEVNPTHGPVRPGDVPHSQASIVKAQMILGYKPEYSATEGFAKACEWYYTSLKSE